MLGAISHLEGATPGHVFDAASPQNVLNGDDVVQWADSGPGLNYGGGPLNIHLNRAQGVRRKAGFFTPGTVLTTAFECDGLPASGVKPEGQPQSASIGSGLEDGSLEIWFRTDLEDTDRPQWQVIWESGAQTNGFALLLRTNGVFPAELRVLMAWTNDKIVDMTVELPGFTSGDFIQAVLTFDGDDLADGNDAVRLFVRDAQGKSASVADFNNDFGALAGSNDGAVFNAGSEGSLGNFNNCGGNVGGAVSMMGFKGEIALINFYPTPLGSGDIRAAYSAVVDRGDDDRDGMSNVWERLYGLDPSNAADARQDADGDGVENLDEFRRGTIPTNADTDDDGLSDGAERASGSNPLIADTDGDGLLDGDEVAANPFSTDPLSTDTDEDSVSDPLELMVGTDPIDEASQAPTLLISEFMASNGVTLEDEDGDNSDWVELVNATGAPVNLGGMYLTDNPNDLTKWRFPAGLSLPSSEFLVVFASGKNRAVRGSELHASFVLSANGEYLALVGQDGETILQEFEPEFPDQRSDVSFAMDGLFHPIATPGEINVGEGVTGFVDDTKFSVDRGYYEEAFEVEITTQTPEAIIVYTTDSSTPSLSNGVKVEGSSATVPIDGTTILRAAAFKDGLAPTNVDTHTYLFPEDIVRQSDNPNDYPYSTWDNLQEARRADYGMDHNAIVDVRYPSSDVIESLKSLPVISIATDAERLFDRGSGNYVNSRQTGRLWEREVSMELFGFAHGKDTQLNGGLRLAGNASRSSNRLKHNMRIAFRREYGDGTLSFPLFADSKVTTFNSIQLRGGNGDSWVNPGVRDRATYLRDQWHRDVHIAMGGTSQVQRFAHLYINGMYWGVYHVFERIEDDYMEQHFGGQEHDWDVRDHVAAFDGTEDAWTEAYAIADDPRGMADPVNYGRIQDHLDLPTFIDWLLVHFYSNSDDWDQNNVRMARMRTGSEGWKFFCWDQERTLLNSLQSPNVNGARGIDKNTDSNTRSGPTHVHQRLRANPEYRLLFADRVQKHCFHEGALTPGRAAAIWDVRAEEVRPAILAESARWGDLHGAAKTLTDWESRVAQEKQGWFNIRTPILIGLLRTRDLFPRIDAPEFVIDGTPQHGGPTRRNAEFSFGAQGGTIYYTLDGSDPRQEGGQAVGQEYVGSIILNEPVTVMARTLAQGEWSALEEAQFSVGVQATTGNLVISKIMYNPLGDPLAEYIELLNISTDSIDLSGVQFVEGLEFVFPDNLVLETGERILVVRDRAAFETAYGEGLPIAGIFGGETALANSGERLRLIDADGETIVDFSYNDKRGWPEGADGVGSALVLMNSFSNPNPSDPVHWRAGGNPGGSDAHPYSDWATIQGVNDVGEDSDGDGAPAALEYLAGGDPGVADAFGPVLVVVTADDVDYFGISFRRTSGREGTIVAEGSADLENWSRDPAEILLVSSTPNPDGSETLLFRTTTPVGEVQDEFLRIVGTVAE